MKIGKVMKKTESNPFRPYTPARKYTVCKVVVESNLCNAGEFLAHLDADPNIQFSDWLLSTLPKETSYFDNILELWFFDEEHVTPVLNKAKEFFDLIHYQDRSGELHTYKK